MKGADTYCHAKLLCSLYKEICGSGGTEREMGLMSGKTVRRLTTDLDKAFRMLPST
jgi:hypothetical protein